MTTLHFLLFFVYISLSLSCTNDEDCQLNGDCVTGRCVCDPAWEGSTCSTLRLLPSPKEGAYQNNDTSSWGGSVIKIGNTYHMYAAEMAFHCGLDTWQSNSIIVHATSTTPIGPFVKQDEVMTYFSHNPTALVAPDGSILIYHIGGGGGGRPTHCTNGSTPLRHSTTPQASSFNILHSTSPSGPWTVVSPPVSYCDGNTTVEGYTCSSTDNPAPNFNSDGSLFVLSRSWNSNAPLRTLIGVAKASSWKGPYIHSHDPIFLNQNEDPFLYTNKRGWHALFHGMDPYTQSIYAGRHAYSRDGWNWKFSILPAYNSTVVYSDGTVITHARRERPHLLIENGQPTHLYTGIQRVWTDDYTFTHVQPINTK